jgi:hypothetical protein
MIELWLIITQLLLPLFYYRRKAISADVQNDRTGQDKVSFLTVGGSSLISHQLQSVDEEEQEMRKVGGF